MQIIHDLFDRGLVVPDVHVEHIDVGSSKLLQAGFETEMHGFAVVSVIVDFEFYVGGSELVVEAVL